MTDDLDKQTMAKAYARWAPVYDLVFGAVFERGRLASIEAAEKIGGRMEVFVKVRSTRPPQAAWLSSVRGEYEIELIDGEDGVSPGQACVLYDGASGQARVLGGGFIRSAIPAAAGGRRPAHAASSALA